MPLRGWIVRPPRSMYPERRLLAAIVVKAIEDARRGNAEASAWLADVGGDWCELLGISPGDWPTAAERMKAARREMSVEKNSAEYLREYYRQYRAKRKRDRERQERAQGVET